MSWSQTFNFTNLGSGWNVKDIGTYTPSIGFTETFVASPQGYVGCNIALTVPPTAVFTRIEVEYSAVLGGTEGFPSDARNLQFRRNDNTAESQLGSIVHEPDGTNMFHVWEGTLMGVNTLLCVCTVGYSEFNNNMGGSITYHQLTIEGEGINPFMHEESDCSIGVNGGSQVFGE